MKSLLLFMVAVSLSLMVLHKWHLPAPFLHGWFMLTKMNASI